MKTLYRILFQRYWNPYHVLILAGLLSALYFVLTSTVWAVTNEFTRLGGDLLILLGVDPTGGQYFQTVTLQGDTWSRTDGWIVWGMFAGALTTVLLSNSFKIRLPHQQRLIQPWLGALLALAWLVLVAVFFSSEQKLLGLGALFGMLTLLYGLTLLTEKRYHHTLARQRNTAP
mgnify:CR=1 FL=1